MGVSNVLENPTITYRTKFGFLICVKKKFIRQSNIILNLNNERIFFVVGKGKRKFQTLWEKKKMKISITLNKLDKSKM